MIKMECSENKLKFGANGIMGVFVVVCNFVVMGNEVFFYYRNCWFGW